MFKAELSIVMESLLPVYHSRMPATQMGAVEGGGTDFGTHMVQTAIDIAKLEGWPIMVLFFDLVKAFDLIVMGLLLGWPCNMERAPVDQLVHLGLSLAEAEELVADITSHGALIGQRGIDGKVISLLSSLHAGAW